MDEERERREDKEIEKKKKQENQKEKKIELKKIELEEEIFFSNLEEIWEGFRIS